MLQAHLELEQEALPIQVMTEQIQGHTEQAQRCRSDRLHGQLARYPALTEVLLSRKLEMDAALAELEKDHAQELKAKEAEVLAVLYWLNQGLATLDSELHETQKEHAALLLVQQQVEAALQHAPRQAARSPPPPLPSLPTEEVPPFMEVPLEQALHASALTPGQVKASCRTLQACGRSALTRLEAQQMQFTTSGVPDRQNTLQVLQTELETCRKQYTQLVKARLSQNSSLPRIRSEQQLKAAAQGLTRHSASLWHLRSRLRRPGKVLINS